MAEVRVNTTGTLKLFDADDSHSASIKAGTISADVASITLESGETVFNEDSADIDFRVESNNNSGMFFINAGSDHVSVGTDGDLGGVFNVSGETVMRTAGNSDTLTLKCTDTDADLGPVLRLSRDNDSAAASDVIGKIIFTGEDAGNNLTDYAEFLTQITDASDGSEDVRFIIKGMVGGNFRKLVDFNTGETSFNDDSDDVDFRVESNGNTHMLFIDAGNDHVNIGTATDLGATLNVSGTGHFETTGNETTLTLKSTDADASSGPRLLLNRESSSPADGDDLGKIFFFGKNDNAEDQGYAEILAEISDASDGTEDGRLVFNMRQAGATTEAIRCEGSNGVVINEGSADVDFRVESNDNTHMFFVDAANNHIIMGTHSDDLGGVLNIRDNSQTQIFASNGGGSTQCMILTNTAGSFSSRISTLQATRNSSSGFDFSRFISNDGNDTEMVFGGSGDINIDGSVTPGGVDYAEYFEWKDGNSSDEDRRGHSVILDEEKIVVATSSDDTSKIIGIVSTNPSVVGGGDIEKWVHKYLRDDYDSLIWEEHTVTEWTDEDGKDHSYDTDRIPSDVTAPSDATVISEEEDKYGNTIKLKRKKLNPEWDSSQQYISREDRKEWEAIGLVGKLRLKKGEPTNPNWIKLRDISDTVEEWLVR
jgi:hypothetical protein